MESAGGKHTRNEGPADDVSGASGSKRAKLAPSVDTISPEEQRRKKANPEDESDEIQRRGREAEVRRIEAQYADLPPLPPRIPDPEYLVDGQSAYSKDDVSLELYTACSRGHLDKVRRLAESLRPPQADLQYGLEKAAHKFQIEIVLYLMKEKNTKLHTRVFEKKDPTRPWGCNIFSFNNPKLLLLLRAFLDNGWHPNQIYERHKVALHHMRCVKDLSILRFLLENGADPTIARTPYCSMYFHHFPDEAPVRRKSGDVLNMAIDEALPQAVSLLVSYGAKLEYGRALHSLVRRFPSTDPSSLPPDSPVRIRFLLADYFIRLGDDINGLRDV